MEDASSAKANAADAAKAKKTPELNAQKDVRATKEAALIQMSGDYVTKADEEAAAAAIIAATKVDSVRGPPGAPIGYGVHKLSIEGGNPYRAKLEYRADEPVNGAQHQPIILPAGVAPVAPPAPALSPEMQYRRDVET